MLTYHSTFAFSLTFFMFFCSTYTHLFKLQPLYFRKLKNKNYKITLIRIMTHAMLTISHIKKMYCHCYIITFTSIITCKQYWIIFFFFSFFLFNFMKAKTKENKRWRQSKTSNEMWIFIKWKGRRQEKKVEKWLL